MGFEPRFQRTQNERIDQSPAFFGAQVHNESNNLSGHEERMKAHCKRVKEEYFDTDLHWKDTHHAHNKVIND